MKVNRNIIVVVLSVLLSILALPHVLSITAFAQAQDPRGALQRGFRTGYSDGYMAGYRDTIDSLSKDLARHAEYIKADRAFNKDYGSLQDYRDGYQQGFESGYDTGFEKRTFESSLPPDLKRRGAVDTVNPSLAPPETVASSAQPPAAPETVSSQPPAAMQETMAAVQSPDMPAKDGVASVQTDSGSETTKQEASQPEAAAAVGDPSAAAGYQAANNAVIVIPRDTELILELQNDLNTQQTREGERFTAKVASPSEIAGATIEGRVTKVRQPGRISRRSELFLSFDRIVLSDNRWSNFSGILVEVIPVKGDNVSRVDTEGTAIGQSSFKQDAIKVGGTTGAGLVVGAVVGGPVGAAVGAGVGAAFGVGAVVIDRGKHVRLNRNQQLRVKTAYETQIR
jgi:hypothetical protein